MTDEELAAQYLEQLKLYRQWKNAIYEGIATGQEPEYLTLQTWLRDNFKPEYVALYW